MQTKKTRMRKYIFLLGGICLLLVACGKPTVLQPTMVPTAPVTATPVEEVTQPATPTDAPSPTEGAPTPTELPGPTATGIPITPLPTQSVIDGTDFLEIMRLLAGGTKVGTEGASEADLSRCFYVEELNVLETKDFKDAGYSTATLEDMQKLRVLYYRKDGYVYIGEMYVNKYEAAEILQMFKTAFDGKSAITSVEPVYIDEFLDAAGLSSKYFYVSKKLYLFLYK